MIFPRYNSMDGTRKLHLSQYKIICVGFHRKLCTGNIGARVKRKVRKFRSGSSGAEPGNMPRSHTGLSEKRGRMKRAEPKFKPERREVLLCTNQTLENLLDRRAVQCTILGWERFNKQSFRFCGQAERAAGGMRPYRLWKQNETKGLQSSS